MVDTKMQIHLNTCHRLFKIAKLLENIDLQNASKGLYPYVATDLFFTEFRSVFWKRDAWQGTTNNATLQLP